MLCTSLVFATNEIRMYPISSCKYSYVYHCMRVTNMCWGRGLPNNKKLERSLQLINTCFFTLEENPRNLSFFSKALRELFEDFYRKGYQSKLEVMIHNTLYMRLRVYFDNPFGKNSRKAFEELRRVKGFKKKSLSLSQFSDVPLTPSYPFEITIISNRI